MLTLISLLLMSDGGGINLPYLPAQTYQRRKDVNIKAWKSWKVKKK